MDKPQQQINFDYSCTFMTSDMHNACVNEW